MSSDHEVTALLHSAADGDGDALDRAFQLVYEELHWLAGRQRARWSGDYTLNTTALVHEAYLKLVGPSGRGWNDRAHFLAVATRAMRQILVNYAEQRRAEKRGGGRPHVSLSDVNPVAPEAADEVLALHEALNRLAGVNPRQARVVEGRFFGGLGIDEVARLLQVSPATVKRDWSAASAWLYREIKQDLTGDGEP